MKKISLKSLFSTRKEQIYQFKSLEIEDFFTNKGIKLQYPKAQVRRRMSYYFWKPIVAEVSQYNFSKKDRNNILKKMWRQMDQRHLFATHTQANYDLESLALCTEDHDNGHWNEK